MKVYHYPIILLLFLFIISPVLAWDDCPRGLTNDPYPGKCANYIDTDNSGFCDHSETLAQNDNTQNGIQHKDDQSIGEKKQSRGEKNYHFGVIGLVVILLYSISWFLANKKIWSIITHRKIWNILLGYHFFVTAILGILLVLRLNYGFVLPLPFNMLFWHVEAGIVFSLIAIFHIAWHWPYFKTYFTKK